MDSWRSYKTCTNVYDIDEIMQAPDGKVGILFSRPKQSTFNYEELNSTLFKVDILPLWFLGICREVITCLLYQLDLKYLT